MHGNVGDGPKRSGSPMPPAITQRGDGRTRSSNGRMAPPFVEPDAPQTPISAISTGDNALPWDTPPEGTVEPAFEADTNAAMAELNQQARKAEFPVDAFIVPEETKRTPAGLEGKAAPGHYTPARLTVLVDRLEKLSQRLRVEDTHDLLRKLARGDRLDAMLAGLLAGYLAGTSEQD